MYTHTPIQTRTVFSQAEYETAKANDELEEAIHIKKTLLPALQAKLQPADVVEAWARPRYLSTLNTTRLLDRHALPLTLKTPFRMYINK